jgi:hypothetical protein
VSASGAAYRCIHLMEQHRLGCYEADQLLGTIGVLHNSCTGPNPTGAIGRGQVRQQGRSGGGVSTNTAIPLHSKCLLYLEMPAARC